MRTDVKAVCLSVLLTLAGQQGDAQQPLSAIDWLNENPPTPAALLPHEPPTSRNATRPTVSVLPLTQGATRTIGLIPSSVTGLPGTLWDKSNPGTLARLIKDLPVEELPAMQSLLYKLLLAEVDQNPSDEGAQILLLARIDKLIALGALEPAQSLIEQAGPERSAALFSRWFDVSLLTGTEDTACAIMLRSPHISPSYSARVFCAARAGDWANAALMLDSSHVLGLISKQDYALLSRFLEIDSSDAALPLIDPRKVTPLIFQLRESIGEPLPAASLARTYASADLRDVAGWKSQLEAAERLSRSGALPANKLLGIYTARKPAASGGIWDRVTAIQRFDTALISRSTDAVSKTLPDAWHAMQSIKLDVSFAQIFAPALADVPLTGPSAEAGFEIALLSPDYETATELYSAKTLRMSFLNGVAKGDVSGLVPPEPVAAAIAEAFGPEVPPRELTDLASNGQLGEAILRAMVLFDRGAKGDLNSLTQSLAAFRAFDLDDIARRASLQLLLRIPEA